MKQCSTLTPQKRNANSWYNNIFNLDCKDQKLYNVGMHMKKQSISYNVCGILIKTVSKRGW